MYEYVKGEYVYGDFLGSTDESLDEKWWYVDGAPEYMVSDYGRVWSKKSKKILKVKPMDKHGHMGVSLFVDGKPRYEYIHRVMAKAFVPNTNNDPIVRHLNDNPKDNFIENLQWGTQKDNIKDCINNGNAHFVTREEREKGLNKLRTPIYAIDIQTGKRIIFESQRQASRILGIQQSNIHKVLSGKRRHAQGYYFEYANKEVAYE